MVPSKIKDKKLQLLPRKNCAAEVGKLTSTRKAMHPEEVATDNKFQIKNISATRMHSIRMRNARSLPYGGGGGSVRKEGSLSKGKSVKGGLCLGASVQWGRGLCPRGSLSRGFSVQGVCVRRGLCTGGSPWQRLPRTETKRLKAELSC